MVKLSSLFDIGKKAVEKIDEKTIDKVAAKVKGIDPATLDKVAGKAGKVVGEKRAQGLADKAKGLLKDENVDAVAHKAKGFVGKDESPSAAEPAADSEPAAPPTQGRGAAE
jgi:hypothetical protein